MVKIGRALSIESRLSGFRCGSPDSLKVIGYVPTEPVESEQKIVEDYFHDLLRESCHRGEWYEATEAVLSVARGDVVTPMGKAEPFPMTRRNTHGNSTPRSRRLFLAQAWIIEYLERQPNALAQEIYRAAVMDGHSRKTVKRAAFGLGVVKSAPAGKYCRWNLPVLHCRTEPTHPALFPDG